MKYDMTKPCAECPFLQSMKHGFSLKQLRGFASGEFPCHKTSELAETNEGTSVFRAKQDSQHCAGALIFNEKREQPHQMMRICERLGVYDRLKLDMSAPVR